MLPRFAKALEGQKRTMPYDQYWRYSSGKIPKLLMWLVERPDLAEALAEDARERAKDARPRMRMRAERKKGSDAAHLD